MEEKLKFAVFIDFDNIEIGVKSTLHKDFDVDVVLEGIKERGEVVSKVAYGNWSRQGQATRAFNEHGVQMVQRDTTPRGDKNGADINLALDALELAFTRDHINAFAIVSGDSDFMALVNKLKQYNKRVYIVGGKAFTSTILQRNCHEFISYESLLDTQGGGRSRPGSSGQKARFRQTLPLHQAISLLDRALRSLELRGAQPQMGLLKSTMLQLDPAFSERDFGANSFSTFIEKLVATGVVTLKTADGQYIVERRHEDQAPAEEGMSSGDALEILRDVLLSNSELISMGIPAREIRALVKAGDPDFEESDYGFSEFTELLNFAQDKGLLRAETSASGSIRYLPGDELDSASAPAEELEAAPSEAHAENETEGRARRARSRSRRRRRRRREPDSVTAGVNGGASAEKDAAEAEAAEEPTDGDAAAAKDSGAEKEPKEAAAASGQAAKEEQNRDSKKKAASSGAARAKAGKKKSAKRAKAAKKAATRKKTSTRKAASAKTAKETETTSSTS